MIEMRALTNKNNIVTQREYMKLYQLRYREKCKMECLIHYGGNPPKCACCGEVNVKFLTMDHMNNDGAKEGRHRSHIFERLKWAGYPEGYQVMCWNCNTGRYFNHGICPHKDIG